MEIEMVFLCMAVLFALAKIASFVFGRFGMPGLIGEILVGILVANLAFGDWSFQEALGLTEGEFGWEFLEVIAELGVMFLLFAVGLETRVKDLLSVGKAAFLVASLGVVFPFVLGYAYIELTEGNMYHALFMGAAMVATSVGITARVIKDMKLVETREARIIIGAAVIDDILGMIILAIVSGMAKSEGALEIADVASITIVAVVFVLAIIAFCMYIVPKIHDYKKNKDAEKFAKDSNFIPRRYNMLVVSIIVCLFFSYLASVIGLAAIIGAFLAGMIFADEAVEWGLEEKVDAISTFLVPFFFIYVGIQVKLDAITTSLLVTTLAIIIVAMITKYVGCGLGAKLGDKDLDRNSMNIIGVGMIPRGEVGIIVASIGLSTGAMSLELYTVVVLMSVITTLIAPFLLSKMFRKKYSPEYQINPADML